MLLAEKGKVEIRYEAPCHNVQNCLKLTKMTNMGVKFSNIVLNAAEVTCALYGNLEKFRQTLRNVS